MSFSNINILNIKFFINNSKLLKIYLELLLKFIIIINLYIIYKIDHFEIS
jgi:hypothetical protein